MGFGRIGMSWGAGWPASQGGFSGADGGWGHGMGGWQQPQPQQGMSMGHAGTYFSGPGLGMNTGPAFGGSGQGVSSGAPFQGMSNGHALMNFGGNNPSQGLSMGTASTNWVQPPQGLSNGPATTYWQQPQQPSPYQSPQGASMGTAHMNFVPGQGQGTPYR